MKFYGELLIYILLLITNLRVFFVKHVRRDPMVSLAPLTFVISILQILSWGADIFTVLAFIIALLVFLSNFHAMFRYAERLYVDHYSPLMKTWSVFTVLISTVAVTGIIVFRPVELQNPKIGVEENITRLKGSFRAGFEKANFVSTADAMIHQFTPAAPLGGEKPEEKGIILFVPDKRGDTINYKPYLQLLAKEGYTVYSGDFFADDVRWMHSIEDMKILRRTASVFRSVTKPQWYMAQREFYTYNISQELEAMLKIIDEKHNPYAKFYLISDETGATALSDFEKKYPYRVNGNFILNTLPEYKTPGYGMIEQTDPLLATYFGYTRDASLKTPKLLVEMTLKNFKSSL